MATKPAACSKTEASEEDKEETADNNLPATAADDAEAPAIAAPSAVADPDAPAAAITGQATSALQTKAAAIKLEAHTFVCSQKRDFFVISFPAEGKAYIVM